MQALYGYFSKNLRGRKGQSGFTLIELLVVVTILGVLAAIVTLSLVGITTNAEKQACLQEYKTVQAGLTVEREVPFELFHLGEWIGRYCADLVVERTLIIEVKTGPLLDSAAIPQLLNYLNVTRFPLGLVLYFGPRPKMKRVIRDNTREYPVRSR